MNPTTNPPAAIPVLAHSFRLEQRGEHDSALDLNNAIAKMDVKDFDEALFSSMQWMGANQSEDVTDFLFLLRDHLSMREELYDEDGNAWARLMAVPVAGSRPNLNALARLLHDRPEVASVAAFGGQAQVAWLAVPFLPEEIMDWVGNERQGLLETGLNAFRQGASVQAAVDAWAANRPSTDVAAAANEGPVVQWTSALLVGVATSSSMTLDDAGESGQVLGWPWMRDCDIWLDGDDDYNEQLDTEPQEKTDRRNARTQEHIEKRLDDHTTMKQAAEAAGISAVTGLPGTLLDALTQRVGLHVAAAKALEQALDETGQPGKNDSASLVHVAADEKNGDAPNCLWMAVETGDGRIFGPYDICAFEILDIEEMVEAVLEWLSLPMDPEKHTVFHESPAHFPGRRLPGGKLN